MRGAQAAGRSLPGRGVVAVVLFLFPVLQAAPASAQDRAPEVPRVDTVTSHQLQGVWPRADFAQPGTQDAPREVSTTGALIRSMIVPGWGHLATESYFRAGFYVAVQGGSYWMLSKSLARRREARRFRAVEKSIAMDRYRAAGVMDPDSLRFLAEADPAVEEWDVLLERRDEQVEDWVFLAAFLALIGGLDAFVSAHLIDFPEALSVDVRPAPGGRASSVSAVEVRIAVPTATAWRLVPWRRSR